MEHKVVIKNDSVDKGIFEIRCDQQEIQFQFGFQAGVEAEQYFGKSTTPEIERLSTTSVVKFHHPGYEPQTPSVDREFGEPFLVFPRPTQTNILPVPLFAMAIPNIEHFRNFSKNEQDDSKLVLASEYGYSMGRSTNGLHVEVMWLSTRFWGGCQWNGSNYELKVVHAMGPIPITWRTVQAIVLPDESLLGIVVSRCVLPTHVQRPAIRINSGKSQLEI